MPAVQPPVKVLVSGATGYIAAWVVQNLLERGYAVRGTARSVAKGDFLKKVFASYGDRFETVVVEDIAKVSLRPPEAPRWSSDDGTRRSSGLSPTEGHALRGRRVIVLYTYRFAICWFRTEHSTRRSKAWMPSNTRHRLSI